MLKEEITPTLEKLKQERTAFMEYQKIQREIEHLSQLVTAHQYMTAMVHFLLETFRIGQKSDSFFRR